jgi:hypothetical protein
MRFSEQLRLPRIRRILGGDTSTAPPRPDKAATMEPAMQCAMQAGQCDVLYHVFFDPAHTVLDQLLRRAAGLEKHAHGALVETDVLRQCIRDTLQFGRDVRATALEAAERLRIEDRLYDPLCQPAVDRARAEARASGDPARAAALECRLDDYETVFRLGVLAWDTKRALFLALLHRSSELRDYVLGADNALRKADGLPPVDGRCALTVTKHLPVFAERYIVSTHLPQHQLVMAFGSQYHSNMANVDIPEYCRARRRS